MADSLSPPTPSAIRSLVITRSGTRGLALTATGSAVSALKIPPRPADFGDPLNSFLIGVLF